MTKCKGCGVDLQSDNSSKPGYIRKDKIDTAMYCEDCFKTIHYGAPNKSKVVDKIDIKDINKSNTPIIYIIDVLNINTESIKYLNDIQNTKKYILLSKIDLLPKSVKEKKIIKYFKDNFYDKAEVMCISSNKNHNILNFYNMLKKDKIKKTFVLGLSNAGKSSFINSIMTINNMTSSITTSPIPNTTFSYLSINIGGIEFIDTPGFKSNTIYNYLSNDKIKLINRVKQLKVKTFQIKSGYSIIIDDLIRIDYLEGNLNSFNFYMNQTLNYKKFKTINCNDFTILPNKTFELEGNEDIVISGLGFIKINKKGKVRVYSLDESFISIRNKMI